MEVHDEIPVHVEELREHLIRELGGKDLKVAGRAHRFSHTEIPALLKSKAGRRNEVLCGKACPEELAVVKCKRHGLLRVEGLIHDLEALGAI